MAAPAELEDHDQIIRWVRAGAIGSSGRARAYFASEWGVPFTSVRVRKVHLRDPGALCECGAPASCGLRFIWKHGGDAVFLSCDACADRERADVVCTAERVELVDLESALEACGSGPMQACRPTDPGAVPYFQGA